MMRRLKTVQSCYDHTIFIQGINFSPCYGTFLWIEGFSWQFHMKLSINVDVHEFVGCSSTNEQIYMENVRK